MSRCSARYRVDALQIGPDSRDERPLLAPRRHAEALEVLTETDVGVAAGRVVVEVQERAGPTRERARPLLHDPVDRPELREQVGEPFECLRRRVAHETWSHARSSGVVVDADSEANAHLLRRHGRMLARPVSWLAPMRRRTLTCSGDMVACSLVRCRGWCRFGGERSPAPATWSHARSSGVVVRADSEVNAHLLRRHGRMLARPCRGSCRFGGERSPAPVVPPVRSWYPQPKGAGFPYDRDVKPRRTPTSTSSFGVSRRENHDSSSFYSRFAPPAVSDDVEINAPTARRRDLLR